MFKSILTIILSFTILNLCPMYANAWEQHALPTSAEQSSTAHYGGNKAPLVLSTSHIKVATANQSGMRIWSSQNDGISWTSSKISNTASITQAYLASDTLALGWSHESDPVIFHYSASSDSWGAASHVWPLASWKIIHVSTSTTGDLIVLATVPTNNNLVEGELFVTTGNNSGWSTPTRVSDANALVGDATVVTHATGLQNIIWSQRNQQFWEVKSSYSNDGQTWSAANSIVSNISAPYFQEAAVHVAADALNHEEVALAFTGWSLESHSQVWSKAFDAVTGSTTQAMSLLPDAGDMVVQPSLVTITNNTWAVAWQQALGIDAEIYVAQHLSDGTWTDARNVSVDPMHMDRDPHIALGSSQTLNVAFTRRVQADVQEVYMFAEGDITDASLDSDNDGIADSQEQGFDFDNDGIDDAQSARVATWLDTGGRYALMVEGNGELRQVQAPSLAETNYEAPSTHQVSGSLFSFQVHALNIGESTQVHLVTPNLLDDDTTWLKLNPSAQWSDSEKDNVYVDATQTGIIIHLTDGGAGDEDGVQDGVIIDPAVLATPNSPTQAPTIAPTAADESQAAGCLVSTQVPTAGTLIMLMMLIGGSLLTRQTIKAD